MEIGWSHCASNHRKRFTLPRHSKYILKNKYTIILFDRFDFCFLSAAQKFIHAYRSWFIFTKAQFDFGYSRNSLCSQCARKKSNFSWHRRTQTIVAKCPPSLRTSLRAMGCLRLAATNGDGIVSTWIRLCTIQLSTLTIRHSIGTMKS